MEDRSYLKLKINKCIAVFITLREKKKENTFKQFKRLFGKNIVYLENIKSNYIRYLRNKDNNGTKFTV